jgi:UDP:flavonoid glycosyltransferase YjiC (YdhE family)
MRILFATLGSLGDLHPILALAEESRQRGHTPVIAAAETYGGLVASLGFEYRCIRPDFTSDTLVDIFLQPRRGAASLFGTTIFPHVRETYDDLLAAAPGVDFIVAGELVYPARLVADRLGLPWANAILSPQSFMSVADPCVLPQLPEIYPLRHLGTWPYRLALQLGRRRTATWAAPFLDLQRTLGLKADANTLFEGKFSPHLVLVLFPAAFAAAQTDWPAGVVQTGFPFFAQPGKAQTQQAIADFLGAGDPPVVFTLGSTAVHLADDLYGIAAEAIAALGRRAILLIGKNPPPAAPPDRLLCVDYAPFDGLFARAAAVVHHGGIGSCAEVMRAGVPSLIIPFGFDQPDNAQRLKRLGIARVLPRADIARDAMVQHLRAILADTAMAARARDVARQIDPARDIALSILAIEEVAKSCPIPDRLRA